MIEAKRMSDYIRMVSLHDRCSTTEERAVVETQALALGVTAFVQEGLTKQQIREEAEVIITIQQNLEDHLVSGVTPAPASSKVSTIFSRFADFPMGFRLGGDQC